LPLSIDALRRIYSITSSATSIVGHGAGSAFNSPPLVGGIA
jgi:hypothetical protein